MPRKGENLYKRKDGRWEGRYILGYAAQGKAKYGYVYAKTYTEAKRRLNECKAGNLLKAAPAKPCRVEEALRLWETYIRNRVKESTYARYAFLIRRHILPAFGQRPLDSMNAYVVEQWTEHLLREGRLDGRGGLSPKTAADILAVLKSVLAYARENGYTSGCHLETLPIKRQAREMRVLSAWEQKKLENVLLTDTDPIKMGVLLCLYSGLRVGELCALRWENLDLSAGILRVSQTMQRVQNTQQGAAGKTRVILTEPKSGCSRRIIPLPGFLAERLAGYQAPPRAFFLTGQENCFVEPRAVQYRFQKYVREAGLEDVNYHALRHTFATRCVELGFEVKSLSEILGHANVNITLNRYVHSSMELKRTNMEKLQLAVSR
ncbi:MAG TPA: site-specific integrase [Candidatus Faecousia intestinigallinarum]|nr:site-specific integrase [Candidatus Faecousia intestinigallinarum]